MEAGATAKSAMKAETWINAYEDGTWTWVWPAACKQDGKGMWAAGFMAEMLSAKVGHPNAGANCAWVPSPTVDLTRHALPRVSVAAV